ncbi:methyl-accepting chemotaxis protein [Pararhodospirillum oryzae]|uniref:Chemotaxis protein n=1 Tax=Pararhodospirillum oryzae TaxID=478448 RepID=A0A512H3B1_9PROT|nr:protoglobin domain-containing protein [Pararhodospirillum oryzae]GEO79921.1 chemotaxis protein [Pararhodospirillum oryzae]
MGEAITVTNGFGHLDGDDEYEALREFHGLDQNVVRTLKEIGRSLEPRLEGLAQSFYRRLQENPTMAAKIEKAGGLERLMKIQQDHWQALFSDPVGPEQRERAQHIGRVHERIGLGTEWFIGAALVQAELFLGALLERTRRPAEARTAMDAVLRMLFFDLGQSVSAYEHRGVASLFESEILTISDMLEREAISTVGEIAHKSARFNQIARQVAMRSQELDHIAADLARTATEVASEIQVIASAASQMQTLGSAIGVQIDASSEASQRMLESAHRASDTVSGLSEAANQIADVVQLIRTIAAQTKLLSLNATIEAARAGEAGKGFAVVAQEVKSLATQTDASIGDVSARASEIRQGTLSTAERIAEVSGSIADMERAASDIAQAAREQRAAAEEVAACMAGAARGAGTVAERMRDVARQAEANNGSSEVLEDMSAALNQDMLQMRDRIQGIVRTSTVHGAHVRVPVAMPARIGGGAPLDTDALPVMVIDLSTAGALIRPPNTHEVKAWPMGTILALEIAPLSSLGLIECRVLMPSGAATHVQFTSLTPAQRQDLGQALQVIKTRDERMAALGREVAAEVIRRFEEGLARKTLDRDDLFDEAYQAVPGSDPPQVTTRFCSFTDRVLPDLLDGTLTRGEDIVFCCVCDRNAYIPTHNSVYSKPQRPGDPVWNTANSRNRRIFDDRAGLLAAHNREPMFFQTYERNMGGGKIVYLKEVDMPIMVGGEHWGSVRLAYRG